MPIALRAVQYGKQEGAERIVICLGEPSVEWKMLEALVVDHTVKWEIVTNMLMLGKRRINELIDMRVLIHPSIDGDPIAQATHRKVGKAYVNCKVLLEHRPSTSCRMTITPKTVERMASSIKYLVEQVGFTSVIPVMATGQYWKSEHVDIAKDQIRHVAVWWLNTLQEGRLINIGWLDRCFRAIWHPRQPPTACGAGVTFQAIDLEGNIWPCHRFCNPNSPANWRLGHIDQGVTRKDLHRRLKDYHLRRSKPDRCDRCLGVLSCKGACWHIAALVGFDDAMPSAIHCQTWPAFARCALELHAVLERQGNELYLERYDRDHGRGSEAS